jgi:LPXTG-motif cell wall-anchored protein
MKRTDSRLLAGLILFVIGAAVLAYGIITYSGDRASLGGTVERVFVGSSSVEQQSIIEMIAGGAIALIGLILLLTRRRRAR